MSANALALEFSVSEDAIRRDLRALAAEGRCKRIYGGALPLSPASTPIRTRITEDSDRKRALALAALHLIEPGDVLFLDSGSTNLALAAVLPSNAALTVVTNSVLIGAEVLDHPGTRLIMIGGSVDPSVGGSVDARAMLELQGIAPARCFLGACSVSAAHGVSAFDYGDATFKKALVAASRKVAVLVTTEKIGTDAPHRVAALDDVDDLVVESDAPDAAIESLSDAGVVVHRGGGPPRH